MRHHLTQYGYYTPQQASKVREEREHKLPKPLYRAIRRLLKKQWICLALPLLNKLEAFRKSTENGSLKEYADSKALS